MSVTAVVVAADDSYLHHTLSALNDQVQGPDRVILLHVSDSTSPGSLPASGAEDRSSPGQVEAYAVPGAANFGAALSHGLAQAGGIDTEWLWLLHDDSPPEPQALAELLRATSTARAVGIAGCKQVDLRDPSRLLSVGVRLTRSARRVTDIEPGEIDQGQYDDREDVYAVGSAGMLIRTQTWQRLGGFSPVLGPFLDGAELSRRTRLAGERVIVVPTAKVRHARASLWHGPGRDQETTDGAHSFLARRTATLHYRLITTNLALLPLIAVAMLLGGTLRALWRLAGNDLALAWQELRAPLRALSRVDHIVQGRRRISRVAEQSRSVLTPLMATRFDVWRLWWHRWRSERVERRRRVAPSELEIAERRTITRRRRTALAAVLLVLFAAVVLLAPRVFAGSAFSVPPLVGGALSGVDQDYVVLWERAFAGWSPVGDGTAELPHPFGVVLALLATLSGGPLGVSAHTAVSLLLVVGVPLAGVAAWFAAGGVTRSVTLRLWAALAWALAPVLSTGINHGRVSAILVHILVPLFALALARTFGVDRRDLIASGLTGAGEGVTSRVRGLSRTSGRPSSGAAAAAGLLLAAIGAAAPLVLPALGIVLLLVCFLARRGRLRLLLVALPPLVLTGPYLWQEARRDGLSALAALDPAPIYLTEFSDAPATALDSLPWYALSGWTHLPHTPLIAGIVTGAIALVALIGLFRAGYAGYLARIGWTVVGVGVLTVVLAGHVLRSPQYDWLGSLQSVPEWAGPGATLAVGGMILAALAAPMDTSEEPSDRRPLRQAGVAVIAVVMIAVVGAAGVNAGSTLRAEPQWQVRQEEPLPAIARQTLAGTDASRVLTLAPTEGTIAASLWRANGPQLVDSPWQPLPEDPARTDLRQLVAELGAATPNDAGARLAEHGIAFVLIPSLDSPLAAIDPFARQELLAALDGLADLQRVTETDERTMWRVMASPTRVRIIDGEQITPLPSGLINVDARIPEPVSDQGGRLELAERADHRWRATLNGTNLRAVQTSWYQSFELPPGAQGQVRVEFVSFAHRAWRAGAVGVLLLTAVLALPVRRRPEVMA